MDFGKDGPQAVDDVTVGKFFSNFQLLSRGRIMPQDFRRKSATLLGMRANSFVNRDFIS